MSLEGHECNWFSTRFRNPGTEVSLGILSACARQEDFHEEIDTGDVWMLLIIRVFFAQ
jgi:hypothetical protein